jgi:hypothetical protein
MEAGTLTMARAGNSYSPPKPGLLIYMAGLILGSGVSFAISTLWLDVTSCWVALTVGATLALLGVFFNENIGEAIIFSLVLCLIVLSFFYLVPGLIAIRAGVVLGACGLSVGKLVAGVWKEFET